MRISKRLKSIADMVTNENVVDIGCDHALLDIYLTLKGKNCIASDISEKVLNNAYKNIKIYNLENEIKIILSDGTKNIEIFPSSTLIISGMGAKTIINILKQTNHINIDELIIQSNNDLKTIRKEIIKMNYYIADERAIYDNKKYYVIIKFKKGYQKYKYMDFILGPILNNNDYFNYLLNNNIQILKKLKIKHLKKIVKYKIINMMIKQKLH